MTNLKAGLFQILQNFVNKQNVKEKPWGWFKSLLFTVLGEA